MGSQNAFIERIAKVAVSDWNERHIMLPSVVIAQCCKESAFGTSELATKANALCGIKLNGWTGRSYRKKADEQNPDGSMRTDTECLWRAYDSWEDSVKDHNTYLKERKVGNQTTPNFSAIIGDTNLKRVIAGLVGDANRTPTAARCTDAELKNYVLNGKSKYPYATGLNYPQSLLDDYIIKYSLTQYDPSTTKYFRVQVGAYSNLENASQMKNRLIAAGFTCIIKSENGLMKCQIGAYKERKNADEMLKKVKASGFNAFVTYS